MVGFSQLLASVTSVLLITSVHAQYKPTFSIGSLPLTWERGQIGSNQCQQWGASDPRSMCQNLFINSARDFCLWAPVKRNSEVGDQEEDMVAFCTKSGYGTRLIPDGTLKSAYFVKTDSFVQVTGYGDFTSMNIRAHDEGGELDPHGATGAGNPPGGLVFTRSRTGREGEWVQLKEWNNFMSATEYSIRACWGPNATSLCPHVYDEMGSEYNEPARYRPGTFEDCDGETGSSPGVYGTSTFHQGMSVTPSAHRPGASSNCVRYNTVRNGMAPKPLYTDVFSSVIAQAASAMSGGLHLQSSLASAYTHRSHQTHSSSAPAHTSHAHSSSTPAHSTRHAHSSSTPAHSTHHAHSSSTPAHSTRHTHSSSHAHSSSH